MITIDDVRTLCSRVGDEMAVSDWLEVTQQRIDQFAHATGDLQWIHVDGPRAAVESPFKTTIAHGFLTLSLVSAFFDSTINIRGLRMALNYGLNRVRFISPVPSGSRIRSRFTAAKADATDGSIQVVWMVTVEREGSGKPACVAEWLVRYYPA